MNQCNDPDHGAINAERTESRGLRKAWVELDDNRQKLEKELQAVTEQRDRLAEAIRLTLMENLDLCDGDICTLKRLKDAVGFDLDSLENDQIHPR
jgi:hypothetical protein